MQDELRSFVKNELYIRQLTRTELARRAKVSRATISDFLNGNRNAGIELARGLAKALDLDECFILIKAGLVSDKKPPVKFDNPQMIEMGRLMDQLPDNEKDELLLIARMKVERLNI